ncbi:choice-of-anchor U domain-containing protein [Desulfocicer niacini]
MRKDQTINGFLRQGGLCLMLIVGLIVIYSQTGWANNGSRNNKEIPEFTREGEKMVATLIPRAKSTSVRIIFDVSGGQLASMTTKPFKDVDRPEVDEKDFKSGLYVLSLDNLPVEGTATITLSSDFFSSSTEFWIFNPNREAAWTKADIRNIDRGDLIRDIILTVEDGGPLDADNIADGSITLVGGPKDSFWGYALGTLFIRFFGIFLVLSILMFGMFCSGMIFEKLDKQGSQKPGPPPSGSEPTSSPDGGKSNGGGRTMDAESMAAAVVALHMFLSPVREPVLMELKTPGATGWVQHGRQRAIAANPLGAHNC